MAFYFITDVSLVDTPVSFQEDDGQIQTAFDARWMQALNQTDATNGSRPNVAAGVASVDIAPIADRITGDGLEAAYVAGLLARDIEVPGEAVDEPVPTGDISGSATIAFGQSGVISGQGDISGAASVTFGQSGTAQGLADISGTTTVTFAPSGAIAATGSLQGTTTVTFGQSGLIAGQGAMQGATAVTFGQTGDLTNLVSGGDISGTASFTFGQSGTITGQTALAGNVSVTFGQSGGLGGQGALQGNGAIVFGQSGDLTGLASGAMSGAATIMFGVSGTLDPSASISRRGDDGGNIWNTGKARQSFYDKQLAEFGKEASSKPNRGAKNRKRKVEALEEKLEALVEVAPEYLAPDLEQIQVNIEWLEAGTINYAEFMAAVVAQIEAIEAQRIAARKTRHRRIAFAMLMAA